jgi:DNA-binding NtrC family response regulator
LISQEGKKGLELIQQGDIQLVLLGLKLCDINPLDILQEVKEKNKEIIFIIMSTLSSVELATKAIKLGALDYIFKTFKLDTIEYVVRLALKQNRSPNNHDLSFPFYDDRNYGYYHILGTCPAMQEIFRLIDKISQNPATSVLIEGESGTGKDLIARMIHYNSRGSKKLFIHVNCSAIPSSLLESELFGYEKGAFTDAKRRKKGLIEEANGGTLYLDEIGEMNILLQAKLLQVLQEHKFRRLGGTQSISIDFRVIVSTNQDLKKAVENRTFREDLYYCLNVITIKIPPLRERKDDIIPLAESFIKEYNRKFNKRVRNISPEAQSLMKKYPWKGNIRELKNVIERIIILEECETILPEHLPPEILEAKEENNSIDKVLFQFDLPTEGISFHEITKQFQRHLINQVLNHTKSSKSNAAKALGLDRFGLYYQMKRLGLSR